MKINPKLRYSDCVNFIVVVPVTSIVMKFIKNTISIRYFVIVNELRVNKYFTIDGADIKFELQCYQHKMIHSIWKCSVEK